MTSKSLSAAKDDFPIFKQLMNGKTLTYLDSASSAQKPAAVIEKMSGAMQGYYANIHRGLYAFSQQMTQEFEDVRVKVQKLVNAATDKEIVFTRNTTEAINLVAYAWGQDRLKSGDNIILTRMEHHANIVPWQILAERQGFEIRVLDVTDEGELDLSSLGALLDERTKLVSFVHVSNVLGTINPAKDIIKQVKAYNENIVTLLDASQSIVHSSVDVQDLACDFMAFTGHKLYGPTGAGVLYGRYDVLNTLSPWQGGGDMIDHVDFNGTTFQEAPHKFEAGTASFVDVIGLGAAIDYVTALDFDEVQAHETKLFSDMVDVINSFDGVRVIGTAAHKAPVASFTMDWAHPSDVNMILDQCGICVRTGQHCAEPLMNRYGLDATLRASLGLYNDENDIDRFAEGLKKAHKMMA